jgi:hypothetical protein
MKKISFVLVAVFLLFSNLAFAKDCRKVVNQLIKNSGFGEVDHPASCINKSSKNFDGGGGITEELISKTSGRISISTASTGRTGISFYPGADPFTGESSAESSSISLNENCEVTDFYVRLDAHNLLAIYPTTGSCPNKPVAEAYASNKDVLAKIKKYCDVIKPMSVSSQSSGLIKGEYTEPPTMKAK